MDAIRVSGLVKEFGHKRVLDSVDLRVGMGEVYGLVGCNGAGKSTLMKILAGLVLPTTGEVEILGERQRPGCTSGRLGALVESPGVYPGLTCLDNVMVRALALGVPRAREASAKALGAVGLAPAAGRRAKACSLGMRQRLGLALVLVGSPDLLVLDEPFNGLDPEAVRELRATIMGLVRDRSVTVFLSSHVLDQLGRMATGYGVIRDGRIVRQMSAAEVEAECSDYLSIRSAEPQAALARLEDAFPQASFSVMPDDAIRVGGGVTAERAGRVLAQAGIAVSEMFVKKRDVEELFVGLMGDGRSLPAAGVASRSQGTEAEGPCGSRRGGDGR
ncbi:MULTISPECIES: ABC transporter ATP-binding protein [Olsenella]|uniref:ABC transporter ATP-binding protein n=1 Tax=Olsenella TaxID=133925 RepID=UPI000791DDC2|nr:MULTISPECIES: ATP-binding cassette domain-containing protein [Olsenella]KXB63292.1 ABC transporter, ATP-binding protein [Olsenella sp. DNF00959]